MSRSGYVDDGDEEAWVQIRWRGAVASAMRGRRGQAFLREMLAALDALPEKRLIAGDLIFDGQVYDEDNEIILGGDVLMKEHGGAVKIGDVCAMGAVAQARKLDIGNLDPYCTEDVAGTLNVAEALAREIAWINDDAGPWHGETPEQRFTRMRAWIVNKISPL